MAAQAGKRAGGVGATTRRRLDPDALADLEQERELLLRSLDDLDREHDAGDLGDVDYEALRDEATRRTAEVVRAIESGRASIAERPRAPRGRLVLAGVGVIAVAVGAGVAVATSSGSREPGTFGSGEVRDLTDDRLDEASALARGDDIQGALDLYDGVLEDDPQNVEALSERGLLLASLSEAADLPDLLVSGRASVEHALAIDPGNPRPLFYLGLIQRLEGDPAAAVATLRLALAADPPPLLRQNIVAFLGQTDQSTSSSVPPDTSSPDTSGPPEG